MLEVVVEMARLRHPLFGIITRSHSEGSPRPRRRFYCQTHLREIFPLPYTWHNLTLRLGDTLDDVLKRLVDTRSESGYLAQVSAVPVHGCCKCKHHRIKSNNTGGNYYEDWQSKPIHKR